MFCPECGTKNKENARFCIGCGYKFKDKDASEEEKVDVTEELPKVEVSKEEVKKEVTMSLPRLTDDDDEDFELPTNLKSKVNEPKEETEEESKEETSSNEEENFAIYKPQEENTDRLRFNKNRYLAHINHYKRHLIVLYIVWILLGIIFAIMFAASASSIPDLMGDASGIKTLFYVLAVLAPILCIYIAYEMTFKTKVKIQEMYWKYDFYSKYIK